MEFLPWCDYNFLLYFGLPTWYILRVRIPLYMCVSNISLVAEIIVLTFHLTLCFTNIYFESFYQLGLHNLIYSCMIKKSIDDIHFLPGSLPLDKTF